MFRQYTDVLRNPKRSLWKNLSGEFVEVVWSCVDSAGPVAVSKHKLENIQTPCGCGAFPVLRQQKPLSTCLWLFVVCKAKTSVNLHIKCKIIQIWSDRQSASRPTKTNEEVPHGFLNWKPNVTVMGVTSLPQHSLQGFYSCFHTGVSKLWVVGISSLISCTVYNSLTSAWRLLFSH